MRLLVAMLLVAGLSACGNIGDDTRYQFGVSAERSATGNVSTDDLLAWKANQICTLGYQVVRQDTIKTEGGGDIVDNHLRCNPYRPSLDPSDLFSAAIF